MSNASWAGVGTEPRFSCRSVTLKENPDGFLRTGCSHSSIIRRGDSPFLLIATLRDYALSIERTAIGPVKLRLGYLLTPACQISSTIPFPAGPVQRQQWPLALRALVALTPSVVAILPHQAPAAPYMFREVIVRSCLCYTGYLYSQQYSKPVLHWTPYKGTKPSMSEPVRMEYIPRRSLIGNIASKRRSLTCSRHDVTNGSTTTK